MGESGSATATAPLLLRGPPCATDRRKAPGGRRGRAAWGTTTVWRTRIARGSGSGVRKTRTASVRGASMSSSRFPGPRRTIRAAPASWASGGRGCRAPPASARAEDPHPERLRGRIARPEAFAQLVAPHHGRPLGVGKRGESARGSRRTRTGGEIPADRAGRGPGAAQEGHDAERLRGDRGRGAQRVRAEIEREERDGGHGESAAATQRGLERRERERGTERQREAGTGEKTHGSAESAEQRPRGGEAIGAGVTEGERESDERRGARARQRRRAGTRATAGRRGTTPARKSRRRGDSRVARGLGPAREAVDGQEDLVDLGGREGSDVSSVVREAAEARRLGEDERGREESTVRRARRRGRPRGRGRRETCGGRARPGTAPRRRRGGSGPLREGCGDAPRGERGRPRRWRAAALSGAGRRRASRFRAGGMGGAPRQPRRWARSRSGGCGTRACTRRRRRAARRASA